MVLPIQKAQYTFADLLAWDENVRIEIIDGEAVCMAAPTNVHQEIKTMQVFLLHSTGILRPHEGYGREDVAKVNVLDGCFIELNKVFCE